MRTQSGRIPIHEPAQHWRDAMAPAPSCESRPDTSEVLGAAHSRLAIWCAVTLVLPIVLLVGSPWAVPVVACVLAGQAAVSLVPAATQRSHVALVALLPAGFIVVCAWALTWGLLAGAMARDGWAGRASALTGVAVFAGLTGLVTRARGGRVGLVGRDWPAAWGAGAVLALFAGVMVTQPFAVWSRVTGSGTDFVRHIRFVRSLRAEGGLPFGDPGYPSALHAMGAWISSSAGLPATPEALWRGVAPLCFLMLALVLLGLMATTRGLTHQLLNRAGTDHPGGRSAPTASALAAILAAIVFAQTAWFDVFLNLGHVMNILAGLCLVALIGLGLEPSAPSSAAWTVVAATAVAVTANAWQLLLPVAALGAMPVLWKSLRRHDRRWIDLIVWGWAFVLSMNGLLNLRQLDTGALVAVSTVSGLFAPDWWWWVAIGFAVLALGLSYAAGLRAWATATLGMLLGAAALTAALFLRTDSTWELMRYYPVKTLWSAMPIVIPASMAGAVCLAVSLWSHTRPAAPAVRISARGTLAVVLVLTIAGVLGRGTAGPPHVLGIADPREQTPNWSMAVVEGMAQVAVNDASKAGAVVFGLVPDAALSRSSVAYAGVIDYLAMEALGDVGIPQAANAPIKAALGTRDTVALCRHLQEFPEALRITGPAPKAGPGLLLDSGCAREVVKPDQWISLDLEGDWLTGSPWANGGDTAQQQSRLVG